jgi:CHAD domain-containing protein
MKIVPLDPKYVKQLSRKLRKILKKKDQRLSPARVHKIRTTVRRVEALADAGIAKPKRRDKLILKGARRIRRQAGKVRDMDVLTADAATIRIPAKGREELVSLLEYLGFQRYREAKRLKSLLRKKGPRLRRGMKPFAARIRRGLQKQSVAGAAFPEVISSTVRLLSELKRPSRFTTRNLHPYRLKVKKLRDVVRLSEDANHSKLAKALGEVKDAIGDWHDWQELARLAGEVLQEPQGVLSQAIANTVHQRYGRALAVAEGLRRDFLRSKSAAFGKALLRTAKSMAECSTEPAPLF